MHHFYHVYADGDWNEPVRDHIEALRRNGLLENLASINIGFVGSTENINEVHKLLRENGIPYNTVDEQPDGWEQVTLRHLEEFVKDNEGAISYAHTKGAANYNPVNKPWRLSMEFYNFVNWVTPVSSLFTDKLMAGCHWVETPTAKFFGGNFWWSRCDVLRQNEPLTYVTRHDAEHWIGLVHSQIPLSLGNNVLDLTPNTPIAAGYLMDKWL